MKVHLVNDGPVTFWLRGALSTQHGLTASTSPADAMADLRSMLLVH